MTSNIWTESECGADFLAQELGAGGSCLHCLVVNAPLDAVDLCEDVEMKQRMLELISEMKTKRSSRLTIDVASSRRNSATRRSARSLLRSYSFIHSFVHSYLSSQAIAITRWRYKQKVRTENMSRTTRLTSAALRVTIILWFVKLN